MVRKLGRTKVRKPPGVGAKLRKRARDHRRWRLVRSEDGGYGAAILFTLVTLAKRLGIEPREYTTDVIARAGNQQLAWIGELTPRARKAERAALIDPILMPPRVHCLFAHSEIGGKLSNRPVSGDQSKVVVSRAAAAYYLVIGSANAEVLRVRDAIEQGP